MLRHYQKGQSYLENLHQNGHCFVFRKFNVMKVLIGWDWISRDRACESEEFTSMFCAV